MKQNITYLYSLLLFLAISCLSFAQVSHDINFESGGIGADWEWIVGENADNPPLEFVANPSNSGINTSATVAKFIARQTGNPWALFFTDGDGEFTFDGTNSIVKIMVYKPVISPIHFKVEGATGAPLELTESNTVINQWEEITFDFSTVIGNTYNRLVILPDFYARPQDNIIYIDNIEVPDGVIITLPEPIVHAPVPMNPAGNVISVFSDAYNDIAGTNLNPGWGQSTVFSLVQIQGDTTMLYGNLNYQGIELGSNQDLLSAGMQYLHLDYWSANSTDLGVYLISPGVETEYLLVPPGTTETWESVDILLTDFTGVDLSNVFQFKFEGNGTTYIDNIYFHDGAVVPVELTSFSASLIGSGVVLTWSTASETNNSGFSVEKSTDNKSFASISFIEGMGTTTESNNYKYVDTRTSNGSLFYRLKQDDFDGSFSYSNVVEVNNILPAEYLLKQNYPNPFNPSTKIKFNLPEANNVKLAIYNALGQEVATLVNNYMSAGSYEFNFDASNLTSGIYFYSVSAGRYSSIKKMMLVK